MTVITPPRPIRLAILEADQPLPQTLATYKGYSGVFKRLLSRAAESLGLPFDSVFDVSVFSVWEANVYPEIDDIDAVLITGSKFSAYDPVAWITRLTEFTKKAIESNRVKVVGVCFGHQIASRALGGKVVRNDKGWEIAVVPINLTEEGQKFFGTDHLKIYQMHRDHVPELPPAPEGKTIHNLGYTEVCGIQGMYVPKTLISVQGHPEFDSDIVREIVILREKGGVFTGEECGDALERLGADDGVEIGTRFIKFLLEDFS